MVDLKRAFETENGVISDDIVLPDSIFTKIRSAKHNFTGDLVSSVEFFNSLTQTTPNRIARIDLTYANDFVTSQTTTIYESDGVTVFQTDSISYNYNGDDIDNIEVT